MNQVSSITNFKLERVNNQNAIKEREMQETKEVEEKEKLKRKVRDEKEQKEKEKLKTKQSKDATTVEKLRKQQGGQLKKFKKKYSKLPKEKVQQFLQDPFKLSYKGLKEVRMRQQLKKDEKEIKIKQKLRL